MEVVIKKTSRCSRPSKRTAQGNFSRRRHRSFFPFNVWAGTTPVVVIKRRKQLPSPPKRIVNCTLTRKKSCIFFFCNTFISIESIFQTDPPHLVSAANIPSNDDAPHSYTCSPRPSDQSNAQHTCIYPHPPRNGCHVEDRGHYPIDPSRSVSIRKRLKANLVPFTRLRRVVGRCRGAGR